MHIELLGTSLSLIRDAPVPICTIVCICALNKRQAHSMSATANIALFGEHTRLTSDYEGSAEHHCVAAGLGRGSSVSDLQGDDKTCMNFPVITCTELHSWPARSRMVRMAAHGRARVLCCC